MAVFSSGLPADLFFQAITPGVVGGAPLFSLGVRDSLFFP